MENQEKNNESPETLSAVKDVASEVGVEIAFSIADQMISNPTLVADAVDVIVDAADVLLEIGLSIFD